MFRQTKLTAFTLIELLIAVAIIGILASIAVPEFLTARTRANIARVEADFKVLADALEMYRVDRNDYPYQYMCRWETSASPPPIEEYGTREQNRYELKVLTTPIAYLNSIPQDVFSPGNKLAAFLEEDAETGSWPYDYTSFKAFSKANFDMSDRGYVIKSRGPDRFYNGGHHHYEVTNGLMSAGDIVRYEGGERAGGWNIH